MPTEVVKTVKQSGGDYSSLSAWEVGEHRNLVTADQIAVAEFWGSTWTLSDFNSFNSGWTVDSTRYIELRVHAGDGHAGVRGAGFALTTSSAAIIRPVTAAGRVHVKGIRLVVSGTAAALINTNGGGFFADGCFVDGASVNQKLVVPAAGDTFQNGFIVGGTNDGWYDLTGANLYFSTLYGIGARAIVNGNALSVVRDVISIHNTGVCFYAATGVTYCISGDTTGGNGTGVVKSATATTNVSPGAGTWVIFTNLTAGSENLNLQDSASNAAENAGTPISGITTDYAGDLRNATTPDIGADEFVAAGGGTAYSTTIGTGTFSLSGQTVGLKIAQKMAVGAGTFALNGQNVTLGGKASSMPAGAGSFSLAGQSVQLIAGRALLTGTGNLSLSGQDVGLKASFPMLATGGNFTLSGQNVNLSRGAVLLAAVGSFALAGQNVNLLWLPRLVVNAGAFTLAGQDVTLSGAATFSLVAGFGAFSLSGQSVQLIAARELVVGPGAFSLAGQDVFLRRNTPMPAGAGSLALSGQVVGLSFAGAIPVGQGTFVLSGQDVTLSGSSTSSMTAGAGAFSLSGQDVGLTISQRLAIAFGAFALSGQDVSLNRGVVIPVGAGTFALVGENVGLSFAGAAAAGVGIFDLAGQDVTLSGSSTSSLAIGTGNFSLAGQGVRLTTARRALADAGMFSLLGQDAGLSAHNILPVEVGAFSLAGQDAGMLLQRNMPAGTGNFTFAGQDVAFHFAAVLLADDGVFQLVGFDVTLSGGVHLHPVIRLMAPAILRRFTAGPVIRRLGI